jgi:hypothetical protein
MPSSCYGQNHSPDCSGNPFLKKKIAAESGKQLLKIMHKESEPKSALIYYFKNLI